MDGVLYKKMGFTKHPFTKFSAEEEVEYIQDIYYAPNYYQAVLQDIIENNTRFVFGERGVGKSAFMFKLAEEIESSDQKNMIIFIDDYSYLLAPGNNITKRYMVFLITNLLKSFLSRVLITGEELRIDEIKKEKLAILIDNFSISISTREFKKFKETHKIYDSYINPIINTAISTGVAISSDVISKSLGLNGFESKETFYRDYLPKTNKNSSLIDLQKADEHQIHEILLDLLDIIKSTGTETILFFFDKIDEDVRIASLINEEVKLLLPLLKQNNLLLSRDFGIIFFLWSKIKGELSQQSVRFDKIKPIDMTWTKEDLRKIIKKRINYFSQGSVSFDSIFQDPKDSELILDIANGSPRDLLRLLSAIYDEQQNMQTSLTIFNSLSVSKGIIKFLSEYDFYSIYPAQRGTKQDIKAIIHKLKQVGKTQDIIVKDFMRTFKYKYQSAISHIKIIKNYGVFEEDNSITGAEKHYKVSDPKIRFIIDHKIELK